MAEAPLYRDPENSDMKAGKSSRGRPRKWPFYGMEVGMTVAIDSEIHHPAARAAAAQAGKQKGWVFKAVKMSNGVLLIKRIE